MIEKLQALLGGAGAIAAFVGVIAASIGGLYWLWVAIQIGSFAMFVVGVVPPLYIVTAPVGA